MKLTRTKAAELIESLRRIVESNDTADMVPTVPLHVLRRLLESHGIPPLERCSGEAHSNAYIDHCTDCMPRWGWRGEAVTVR